MQKKRQSLEYLLRTQQHLSALVPTCSAVVFRDPFCGCLCSIHQFFQDRGFVYVNTADAEAGEMFRVTTRIEQRSTYREGDVDYSKDFWSVFTSPFSVKARQRTFAMALVTYYLVQRSEYPTHAATQQKVLDDYFEMAFCDLAQDMDVAEEMLRYVTYVLEHCPDELDA